MRKVSYVNVEKIRFINKIGGELTTMAMKTPLLQCFHETFDLYPELEDLSHLNFYQEINQTELFNNKQLMLAAVRKDGFF